MGLVRVQHVQQTVSGSATFNPSWSQATVTGNTLIAVVCVNNGGAAPSLTSTPGSYALIETRTSSGIGENGASLLSVYVVDNAASQTATGTWNSGNAASDWLIELIELSGANSGGSVDQHTGATASTTPATTGTTGTTTVANEYIIACFTEGNGTTFSSPSAGYALVDQGSTAIHTLAVYDQTVSSTGTQTCSATVAAGDKNAGVIVTFKQAAAAAVTAPAMQDVAFGPGMGFPWSFRKVAEPVYKVLAPAPLPPQIQMPEARFGPGMGYPWSGRPTSEPLPNIGAVVIQPVLSQMPETVVGPGRGYPWSNRIPVEPPWRPNPPPPAPPPGLMLPETIVGPGRGYPWSARFPQEPALIRLPPPPPPHAPGLPQMYLPETTLGPGRGYPWSKVLASDLRISFPAPIAQGLGPQIWLPESFTGPPIPGAPWRFARIGNAEHHHQSAPPPPTSSPQMYLPEVMFGPGRGFPWSLRAIPGDLIGMATPPAGPAPIPQVPPVNIRKPFLERVPEIESVDGKRRLARVTEKLSQFFNSLLGQGIIVQIGTNSFALRGGSFVMARAPTAADDASQGVVVGSVWTNTANNQGYMCMSNALGAAVWKQITT